MYVLQTGDSNYTRNRMVTSDVREVAEKYVELIEEGAFGDLFSNPSIQIWTQTEEEFPYTFNENVKSKAKLIKYLSKLGQGIQD